MCFRSSVMYKGAILNIQKNSQKASSCPDIYNNNSTLTVASEPDSVSIVFFKPFVCRVHLPLDQDDRRVYCIGDCTSNGNIPDTHTFLQMFSHRDSFVKVINQLSSKRVNTVRRVRRKRSYFHPKTLKKVR